MLNEYTVQDKIEIVGEHKMIQVRTATVIERDGVEIARSFHRHIVAPSDDVTTESDEVKAIAKAVHTAGVKKKYAEHLKSLETPDAPAE